MDSDVETLTSGWISMCVPVIEKLHGSLRLLSFVWDGIVHNPRALLSYIEKSKKVTLTRDFFAKKLTSSNPIWSLISGTRSSLILSGDYIFVGIGPS